MSAGWLTPLPRAVALVQAYRRIGYDALIMLSTAVGIGLFHYLSQVSLGHFLRPADYGAVYVLLTIVFMATTLMRIIESSVVRFTVQILAEERPEDLGRLWMAAYKQTALVSGVILICLGVAAPYLSRLLDLGSWWYLVLTALAVGSVLIGTVNSALLRGMQRPGAYAAVRLPVAAGRLVITLALGWVAWGVPGALVAVIVANLAGLAASHLMVSKSVSLRSGQFPSGDLYRYSGFVLLVVGAFTLVTTGDVIVARYFLSPESSGIYAGVAVLGKVTLFLATGFALTAFSLGSQEFEQGRDVRRVFRAVFLVTAAMYIPLLLFFHLFPGFVIRVALGEEYIEGSAYLWSYGLAMALFGLSWIALNLALVTRRWIVVPLLGVPIALEFALLSIYHADIGTFVNVLLVSGVVCLALTSWPLLFADRRKARELSKATS